MIRQPLGNWVTPAQRRGVYGAGCAPAWIPDAHDPWKSAGTLRKPRPRRADLESETLISPRLLDRRNRPVTTLASLRAIIASVPRGKVITYGQAAAAGGHPGAARLTVWALNTGGALPWHRVVAAGGRIALPGELGQEQRLRLSMEGVTFRGARVRMEIHNWIPTARRTARTRAAGSGAVRVNRG